MSEIEDLVGPAHFFVVSLSIYKVGQKIRTRPRPNKYNSGVGTI